jgi:hypothetical protein
LATIGWSELVESRMGAVAWGLWPTLRFPSPLIEPDIPISGIRLSDWIHREAHGEEDWPQACSAADFPPSPFDTAVSDGSCH